MTRRVSHFHPCARCSEGTISCISVPEMDEDGRGYCPGEAHPEQYACEDCLDLEQCEMCGMWFPRRDLTEQGMTMMCAACVEHDMADEEEQAA